MNGWFNQRLRVVLNEGKVIFEPIGEEVLHRFIGGRGINDWVLYNEVPADAEPLGPDNIACFGCGPLTGTIMPMNSRCHVSTIGPHNGMLGDGNGGSLFPYRMKQSGIDQIVITGQSESPVYLWIDDGEAQLLDAASLWGLDTWQCTDALKDLHGRDIGVACIGQAGENLVRFASVIFDKYSSAARGAGAVLGAKKLKAIAVRGTIEVPVYDRTKLKELADLDRHFFFTDPFQKEVVRVIGTHHGLANWFPGWHNNASYLKAEEVPESLQAPSWKKYELHRTGCHTCPAVCKDVYRIPEGDFKGEVGSAMEYEGIHCLGINCGITDPSAVMAMQNLSDKYGMCVIPLGNCLALAKDLFSRGYLSIEDTGGLDLSWANTEDQIRLIHQTAFRQGFGAVIAEGETGMNRILGPACSELNDQVKGTGRGNFPPGVFALAHATSTRGSDHLRGRSWTFGENDGELFPQLIQQGHLPSDEIERLIVSEDACALNDCIGRCKGSVNSWVNAVPLIWKYPLYEGLSRVLTATTGHPFTSAELAEIGKRVYLLEIALNSQRGIKRQDWRLVQRPELRDTEEGARHREEFQIMLDRYLNLWECDLKEARPKPETLKEYHLL